MLRKDFVLLQKGYKLYFGIATPVCSLLRQFALSGLDQARVGIPDL
jgi:hypothetical protein